MCHLQLIANGSLQARSWLRKSPETWLESRLRTRAYFRAIFQRASKLTALELRHQFTGLPSPTHAFSATRAAPLHFPTTLSQPQNRQGGRETWGAQRKRSEWERGET